MPRKRTRKRVSITIPESCYDDVIARDLNLSGLITNLLQDHFAGSTITIRVNAETQRLYQLVVSNTGYHDEDIEVHLRAVLQDLLGRKITELETIRQQLAQRDTA